MAIKRSFNLKNKKARTCLKCGRAIPKEALQDDKTFQCQQCGQRHFVDVYGGVSCCLTIYERPELRRRHTDFKTQQEALLAVRLAATEERAREAEKRAEDWEKAAEELSRMVENLTEEKNGRGDPGA